MGRQIKLPKGFLGKGLSGWVGEKDQGFEGEGAQMGSVDMDALPVGVGRQLADRRRVREVVQRRFAAEREMVLLSAVVVTSSIAGLLHKEATSSLSFPYSWWCGGGRIGSPGLSSAPLLSTAPPTDPWRFGLLARGRPRRVPGWEAAAGPLAEPGQMLHKTKQGRRCRSLCCGRRVTTKQQIITAPSDGKRYWRVAGDGFILGTGGG
jgi:hypothetical protein